MDANKLQEQMKELLSKFPPPPEDPFAFKPMSFAGFDVLQAPGDVPHMQLSEKIMEILDPKFAAETNAWLRERFGMREVIPKGMAYVFGNKIMMRPESVVMLTNLGV